MYICIIKVKDKFLNSNILLKKLQDILFWQNSEKHSLSFSAPSELQKWRCWSVGLLVGDIKLLYSIFCMQNILRTHLRLKLDPLCQVGKDMKLFQIILWTREFSFHIFIFKWSATIVYLILTRIGSLGSWTYWKTIHFDDLGT